MTAPELTAREARILARIAAGESPYTAGGGLGSERGAETSRALNLLWTRGLWRWETVAYRSLTAHGQAALNAWVYERRGKL